LNKEIVSRRGSRDQLDRASYLNEEDLASGAEKPQAKSAARWPQILTEMGSSAGNALPPTVQPPSRASNGGW
jgi:hypothetical protein